MRPTALLETLLKLTESVAVDQHADHSRRNSRVRDGAESMTTVGKNREVNNRVATDVWQGRTLSIATFSLTLWSKMKELLDSVNSQKLVMGFISYADDFSVIVDEDGANDLFEETKEIVEVVLHGA